MGARVDLRTSLAVWGAAAWLASAWISACGGNTTNGSANRDELTSDSGSGTGGRSGAGPTGDGIPSGASSWGSGCMPGYICDSFGGSWSGGVELSPDGSGSDGAELSPDGSANDDAGEALFADVGTDARDACSYEGVICEFYSPWDCISGEVYAIVDPCWICGPSHWEPVLQCESGCRIDLNAIKSLEFGTWGLIGPEALCEENRPQDGGSGL